VLEQGTVKAMKYHIIEMRKSRTAVADYYSASRAMLIKLGEIIFDDSFEDASSARGH
jgi:hypothetical protein